MATQDPTAQLTSRTRLETLSDGVIAISITLTVLSIGVPHGLPRSRVGSAIVDLIPDLLTCLLSFAVIGLFWMSHHGRAALVAARVGAGVPAGAAGAGAQAPPRRAGGQAAMRTPAGPSSCP